jgi:hypothetical protein
MQSKEEQLSHLKEIRSIMERSARFISLSGLSGVGAGLSALLGATVAYLYLGVSPFQGISGEDLAQIGFSNWGIGYELFFLGLAALVLMLAFVSAIFFTTRRARREGLPVWDALTRRLLLHLFVPLVAGGIFCFALYFHGLIGLLAPATLVFYGLALLNASKYTLTDVWYLGLSEIGLGLLGMFFFGYGLDLWAIGFGVLHIVYGLVMYRKYERD